MLLALIACALLRGLVLHTAFDEVGLWMYELFPIGTLAEACLRGIRIPLHFFYDNAAGQLLSGILAVPAFVVLGPTYLALKLVPFLMGLGVLLCVYHLVRGCFGGRAAALATWLLVLPPTTYFKWSLVCGGNHFENVFFTSLLLLSFYRLHRVGVSAPRVFLTGAAAGLALFVFLGALIPLGILAFVHLGIRGPRASLRDLAAAVPGALLGVSPLLVLNVLTRGRGMGFLAAKFGEGGGGGSAAAGQAVSRISQYLAVHLPRAAAYPDWAGIDGKILDWTLFAALAVAWLACLPRAVRGVMDLLRGALRSPRDASDERARFESASLVPMVAYLPLSALAYGFSNLAFAEQGGRFEFATYRYFLPHFLLGTIALAVVCARALARGGAARFGGVLLAALALVPGLSNLAFVDWSFSHTGLGARYEGYDLSKLGRALISSRNALAQEEIVAYLEGFPPRVRSRVARAIGFNVAVLALEKQRKGTEAASVWVDLDVILRGYPDDRHADLAHGAGIGARFLFARGIEDPGPLLPVLARTAERSDPRRRDLVARILEGAAAPNPNLPPAGDVPGVLDQTTRLIQLGVEQGLAQGVVEALARGEGILCGRLLRRGIQGDVACVERARTDLSAQLHSAFFRGLGAGCAEGGEAPGAPADFLIPAERRIDLWQGFAERLREIHGADAAALAEPVGRGLAPEDREVLQRALAGS